MSNARGKAVDTTYLSLENARERGFIHRDYIAHVLRWSHVAKRLQERKNYERARILDVGCGRELPLPKMLYSSRLIVNAYYGVDYGPIPDESMQIFHTGKFPLTLYENTDITNIRPQELHDQLVNWVTCFEVLEHVEPQHMVAMLRHIRGLCTPDALLFFSTPCYNWTDVAANHVSEITYEALGAVFEALGFGIVGVHGTFASIRDYEHLMVRSPEGLLDQKYPPHWLFEALREYYDVNFLSCIFAPLFPAQSRNCIWELRMNRVGPDMFPQGLLGCKAPWTSSANWESLLEAVK